MSELQSDDAAAKAALTWIDSMTDQQSGRTGYTEPGGRPSRQTEFLKTFPPELSESMTAVGVMARVFGDRTAEDDPMIAKGVELMLARPPKWDEKSGEIDFYYWYYATLAMYQVGGPRWDRWNESMKDAILDHQRLKENECEYGSWDPIDPWSPSGGRVYSTAVLCLCTLVYYRYPRVFGGAKRRTASRPKHAAPWRRALRHRLATTTL
jgi:hypothetical protein